MLSQFIKSKCDCVNSTVRGFILSTRVISTPVVCAFVVRASVVRARIICAPVVYFYSVKRAYWQKHLEI